MKTQHVTGLLSAAVLCPVFMPREATAVEEDAKLAVNNITKGQSRVDPENKAYYENRKDDYLKKVEETFTDLHRKMEDCGTARQVV